MPGILYLDDAYLQSCETEIIALAEPASFTCARTVFYPEGGGQPGDSGFVEFAAGDRLCITNCRYAPGRTQLLHLCEEGGMAKGNLRAGDVVRLHIDWPRRHRMMRMHTALHLLSVILAYPVTGGKIGPDESRLDFDIPEMPFTKDEINQRLAGLIAADHPVTTEWIDDAELDANPDLVKTMSVAPPRGTGKIRLVRIGTDIDLQPCGGTHVRSTGEAGPVLVSKIEKKGRQNRRVRLRLGA